RPLRDNSLVHLKPHVVSHPVRGVRQGYINREEACAVASLIAAAIEQPEYARNERDDPVSFGVISLLGDEQAIEIERLLRQRLAPEEYERRRILCGNAAQFQGDERDV